MTMPTYAELLNQLHHREASETVPTQWYEYRVGPDGTQIERHYFAPGTVLGTGTVHRRIRDKRLCVVRPPAEVSASIYDAGKRRSVKLKPDEHTINVGRIAARLVSGDVQAHPIDAPEGDEK